MSDTNQLDNAKLFGEICWLMTQSPLQQEWPIKSLKRWVLPALMHQQFRIYHREGIPVAYVSWAWMSKVIEERYVKSPNSLQPKEWKCGDRVWMVDFVAPFGDAKMVLADLRNNLFKDQQGRALRLCRNKPETRIIYFHGRGVSRNIASVHRQETVQLS